MLPASRASTVFAVVASSILFGVLHLPAAVFLWCGLENVPNLFWFWVIGLNTLLGIVFSLLFFKFGIGAAILGHFGTDLVWHVISQLFS